MNDPIMMIEGTITGASFVDVPYYGPLAVVTFANDEVIPSPECPPAYLQGTKARGGITRIKIGLLRRWAGALNIKAFMRGVGLPDTNDPDVFLEATGLKVMGSAHLIKRKIMTDTGGWTEEWPPGRVQPTILIWSWRPLIY